jgi:hypothetical protein
MATPTNPPICVAVDTNVPLDFAIKRELVIDALATIRKRTLSGPLPVPPSVAQELAFIPDHGEIDAERDAASSPSMSPLRLLPRPAKS